MEVGLDELELYRINSYNYYCGNTSSSNRSFFKWCPSGQAWFQDQSMMGNYLVIQPCLKNISLIELCTFFLCAQTFSSKGAVNSTTLICDLVNWFKNKIKTPRTINVISAGKARRPPLTILRFQSMKRSMMICT